MKNIYKLIAVILTAALLIPGAVFAAQPVLVYEIGENDEYAPDSLMVTIREEYSGWNKLFSAEDFPEIPVTKIQYITPLFEDEDEVPMLDTTHYKQVLLLRIDPDVITVPDAMEKLSANEAVLEIFPDLSVGLDGEAPAEEYAPDRVIVTITEADSGWNKLFSAEDFPEVPVREIQYITPLFEDEDEVPMLDTTHYKQMLVLIIDDAAMSVEDAVAAVKTNGIVLDAMPDYIEHVEEPIDSCLPGDINCDWELGAKDASLLVRYLAGWNVEITPLGADLGDYNRNGQLDAADLAIMMKALAGYSVLSVLEQERFCELYFDRYCKGMETEGGPMSPSDVWIDRIVGTFADDCTVVFMSEEGAAYTEVVIHKQIGNTVVVFPDSQMCSVFTKDAVYSLEEAYENGLLTDADLAAINTAIGCKG